MLAKVRNCFFEEGAQASRSDKFCIGAMMVAFIPVLLAVFNSIFIG